MSRPALNRDWVPVAIQEGLVVCMYRQLCGRRYSDVLHLAIVIVQDRESKRPNWFKTN
jgi:hypothetical protein